MKVRKSNKVWRSAIVSSPWLALSKAPHGTYRWSAKCARAVEGAPLPREREDGRVVRANDLSGQKSLPMRAPHNSLNSTGRTYTVMYQNRYPAITLFWSGAPDASSYELQVRHTNGRVIHSGRHQRARLGFPSGRFRDGEYYWFWRAVGGSETVTSSITRMRIRYDQQTPAIYIAEPKNGASAGGSIRVRGEVAVGSRVLVNGVELDIGSDHRFDQTVNIGSPLVLFRVSTPGRGNGIYVRHLR